VVAVGFACDTVCGGLNPAAQNPDFTLSERTAGGLAGFHVCGFI
jgi:hypothetical protein